MLTSVSSQAVSSPLKTLLEIIVKYHIEGFKNDKITCSESDAVWSARTVSSIANSAAATPAVMSDVKAEVDTTAFVVSKHNKLRYFTRVVFDFMTLCCLEFVKLWDFSLLQVCSRRSQPFSAYIYIIIA